MNDKDTDAAKTELSNIFKKKLDHTDYEFKLPYKITHYTDLDVHFDVNNPYFVNRLIFEGGLEISQNDLETLQTIDNDFLNQFKKYTIFDNMLCSVDQRQLYFSIKTIGGYHNS